MNKVTDYGNMYKFINYTINQLGGECIHKCKYCSTQKFYYPVLKKKYSGIPRLDEKALNENLGHDNFIFIVAQNDLFAEGIHQKFARSILEQCNKYDNEYLYQTKNPAGLLLYEYIMPQKSTCCITLETNRYYPDIMGNCPKPMDRILPFFQLRRFPKMITVEPILDFELKEFVNMIRICSPFQVNIGANSFNKVKVPEPSKEKLLTLIAELELFTKVIQKENLQRLLR